MATARDRGILALVVAAILLGAGLGVGVVVDDLLGLRTVVSEPIFWAAGALLVLAAAWLLIGMFATRTRLVGRPGAAAARATWLGSTRPWRARESTLGLLPLDRWLLLIVPGGLLVATRLLQSASSIGVEPALVLAAWIAFIVVVRALVGRRSPWPIIAAVGGVVVLRCIVALAVILLTGPGAFRLDVWGEPAMRVTYIAVAFALFVWLAVAAGWALSAQFHPRRAWGTMVAGAGAALALPALAVSARGDTSALAAGLTGVVVCVVGVLLALLRRPRGPVRA